MYAIAEIDIQLAGPLAVYIARYAKRTLLGQKVSNQMKNKAKCKVCQSIIESFHASDYVTCKCGHISVSGGLKMECSAIDWSNFLRVDDQGNEIAITVKDADVKPLYNENPTREDKLKLLDEMIKTYENLPPNALNAPITGYDLLSSLILISSILRS